MTTRAFSRTRCSQKSCLQCMFNQQIAVSRRFWVSTTIYWVKNAL